MMKSLVLTVATATMLLVSGTAAAEVVKIDAGPTLNPFFLRLVCNRVAAERGGRFVRSERSGPGKNGVCYIDVPKRSGIVATPGVVRQPAQVQPQYQNQPQYQTQPQPPVRPVQQQNAPIQQPQGRVEMVSVGRLWSQSHAEERCRKVALKEDAKWTGIWKKHDSRGEAQCQLRRKPEFVIKAVPAGKIWSDSHARSRCPRIARDKGGVWANSWQADPKNKNRAVCMVKMKKIPSVVKPFKTIKIWSEAHAKEHCNRLAQQNKGEWQGKWRNSEGGKNSVCMIKVPKQFANNQAVPVQQTAPQPTAVSQNASVRNVKAGDIWDQKHAERKCPVVARNAKGSWTQRWTKTGPGNQSVCEVRFGGGIVAQASRPATPIASNTRARNVAAGQIWDDKQAAKKCPLVAANNKAKWTGNWTKTGPGHVSVCEISVTVAGSAAQSQPAPAEPSTIREAAAGGIWDQAHANRKCPIIATNNKARWTGKWRKVGANNAAVCEIDTRQ